MKERGVDSPDDGDALALTFARNVAPKKNYSQGSGLMMGWRLTKGIKWA